ncbi:MAG TPA: Ig-like domain repeat protein, partial [Pseudacidobacterium sp.]|nr:Ig-like domain repeat protein [Pseudacidobacterium sp.]
MMHRRIVTLFLFLFAFVNIMRGQNVAFDPGFVSLITGDPSTIKSPTTLPYNSAASGLVFSSATNYMSMAVDSYGNIYVSNNSYIWAIASGNGPVPVLPSAGTTPTRGNAYIVAGNGTIPVPSAAPPCATGTDAYGNGCPATQAFANPFSGNARGPEQGGLAVDSHNNLFILDKAQLSLRVIYSGSGPIPNLPAHAQAGYIYAIAATSSASPANPGDGGPALNATFNDPTGLSIDNQGNIYITDAGNFAVRVIYQSGSVPNLPGGAVAGNIYTIGGTLGASCPLNEDSVGHLLSLPCGDNGPATSAQLGSYTYGNHGPGISGVYVDANGNIFINDTSEYRVRVIYAGGKIPSVSNPSVGYIYTIAGNGYESGFVDISMSPPPLPPGLDGPALNTTFATLSGITGDAGGNIYITDADASSNQPVQIYNAVRKIDPSGNITTIAPYALAVCSNGNLSNSDGLGDGCPANAAQIGAPVSIGIDPSGNLFVSDQGSSVSPKANSQAMAIVHEISVNQTSLTAASTISRPQQQVVTLTNTGAQALQLNGIAYQGNNGDTSFSQGPTGGSNDCAPTTLLNPGASCQIGINFTPESAGTFSGALAVSSNAQNAVQGMNLIELTGTAIQSTTTTNLTITPEVANQGQQVTLTATMVPDYGSEKTPTGSVTFTTADGATTLGTANITNGIAILQVNNLNPGTYSLIAT